MRTPSYEVIRIGDRYVPVKKDPYPEVTGKARVGGGILLTCMGLTRRGLAGDAALIAGATLLLRSLLGFNPLKLLSDALPSRDHNGRADDAPSYQNDAAGRATQAPLDAVDEQSMESFPASDAPARTGIQLPH